MLSFSVFGIRITVRFWFCMVILWMLCVAGEAIVPCLICSALHECGHLLICARYRLRIRSLDLNALGLKLRLMQSQALLTAKQSFLLHGGGILMTLICGVVFAAWGLTEWMKVSFILTVFHLIPMREMDGGRMFVTLGMRLFGAQPKALLECVGQGIGCLIFAFFAAAAIRYGQNGLALMLALFAVCGILPARGCD